jgi:hypothetical protein
VRGGLFRVPDVSRSGRFVFQNMGGPHRRVQGPYFSFQMPASRRDVNSKPIAGYFPSWIDAWELSKTAAMAGMF